MILTKSDAQPSKANNCYLQIMTTKKIPKYQFKNIKSDKNLL